MPLDEAPEAPVRATQSDMLEVRDIDTALQQLSVDQRQVLLLVAVERMSYEETARALGIPIGTVMSRLARGRERLHLAAAQWMEKRGHGPNDGLVPVASALIPGARHVILPGSHIATVSRGPGRDPVALMWAGLDTLFSAERRPAT